MKKTVCIVVFVTLCCIITAQSLVKTSEVVIDLTPFRVEGMIDHNLDKPELILLSKVKSVDQTGMLIRGGEEYPVLYKIKLNNLLEVESSSFTAFAENPENSVLKVVAKNSGTTNIPLVKYSSLQKQYPSILIDTENCKSYNYPILNYLFRDYQVSKTTMTCKNDLVNNRKEYVYNTIRVNREPFSDEGKFLVQDKSEKNLITKELVSLVAGLIKSGKENKHNEYKDLYFVTHNKDGKIIDNNNIRFEYARRVWSGLFVWPEEHAEENGFIDIKGIVYILGKYPGIGKKSNDPDNSKFDLVYIDSNGKFQYHIPFTYGDPDRSHMEPSYSFAVKDDIYFISKCITKPGNNYVLAKFNKDGNQFMSTIDFKLLKENTVGDYENGARLTFSGNVMVIDHKILSNGDIVVYGQPYTETSTTVPSTTGGASAQSIKEYEYANHFVWHFTSNGELNKQYVINQKGISVKNKPSLMKLIQEKDNSLYFVVNEIVRVKDQHDNWMSNFITPLDKTQELVSLPRMVKIDLQEESISTFDELFDEPVINFYGDKNYLIGNDNAIYLYGYNNETIELPLSLMLYKVEMD